MKEYTEAIHAERLLKILKKDTCNKCPATKYFNDGGHPGRLYKNTCEICQKFVGLKYRPESIFNICPCKRLGKERAIEKSWLVLEKKGYLAK